MCFEKKSLKLLLSEKQRAVAQTSSRSTSPLIFLCMIAGRPRDSGCKTVGNEVFLWSSVHRGAYVVLLKRPVISLLSFKSIRDDSFLILVRICFCALS